MACGHTQQQADYSGVAVVYGYKRTDGLLREAES
jgi:hypothetical protein